LARGFLRSLLADVAVRCRGDGCPFASRRVTPRNGSATLTSAFRKARLRPRAIVEITVSVPGKTSRAFRITARRFPRNPLVELLCQRSGATKPAKC